MSPSQFVALFAVVVGLVLAFLITLSRRYPYMDVASLKPYKTPCIFWQQGYEDGPTPHSYTRTLETSTGLKVQERMYYSFLDQDYYAFYEAQMPNGKTAWLRSRNCRSIEQMDWYGTHMSVPKLEKFVKAEEKVCQPSL